MTICFISNCIIRHYMHEFDKYMGYMIYQYATSIGGGTNPPTT
jgi:hypothetical protein